jgi:hypothetical protein
LKSAWLRKPAFGIIEVDLRRESTPPFFSARDLQPSFAAVCVNMASRSARTQLRGIQIKPRLTIHCASARPPQKAATD